MVVNKRLGIVINHYRPEVLTLAEQAISWCAQQRGPEMEVQPVISMSDVELLGREDLAVSDDAFGPDLDVCLSLGGDGTMLRSVSLMAAHGVPILGINAGQMGYLTEVEPGDLQTVLRRWLEQDLQIERRMLLHVASPQHPDWSGYALNEAVVSRTESARTVDLSAAIDGSHFTSYVADGLIVATPTGSTAYSLSAGGPIVQPDFEALLLTPVAAHTVFNRSMVLASTAEVELTVGGYAPAVVALDGSPTVELEPGQSVICRAASFPAKLLVSGTRDFHTVLKEKFGLKDR